MSTILLGCDLNNRSSDKKTLSTVKSILENAGHNVETLEVGPNYVQSAMLKKSNKGKVAIYLVNGADLQTYKDFAQGIKQGYYHVKYAYFGLQGWISPSTCSCKGAKTAKLKRAHDDQSAASYTAELVGMTTEQVCEKYKSQIAYACGSSAKELGNNLVSVINGGNNSSSSSSKKESTGSTIKEALKKAVSGWDGDVSIHLLGDTVYVGKIPSPMKTILKINEFDNVLYDNVTVTDINPDTVNHLTCNYKDYTLTLQDDILIKRFGKISKKIKCDSSVKSLEQAKDFLQREFNKIRRDDGRQVECKVQGDSKWRTGAWCHVYLPSYFIDDYMYISKCSHDEDGTNNWTANLTLVDYPPSFGTFEEDKEEESS